jgi:hypothetical protein
MDREHDQEAVVDEGPGETESGPRAQVEPGADALPVRRPPLIELTTPSGRIWYIVNPN